MRCWRKMNVAVAAAMAVLLASTVPAWSALSPGNAPPAPAPTTDEPELLTLQTLTVAQAEALVKHQAEKPDLPFLGVRRFPRQMDDLLLAVGVTWDRIRRLRKDVAERRSCGAVGSVPLELWDFLERTTSPEWQGVANRFRNFLHLPALTTLTPEVATVLAQFPGQSLNLRGLTTLTPEAAEALVAGKPAFRLGLATLTPEVATALSGFTDGLSLPGLTTLTPEVAAALAAAKGGMLDLPGLTELTPAVAVALGKFQGVILSLPGLTTLNPDVGAALGKLRDELTLPGLTSLTPEAALALATGEGRPHDLAGPTERTAEDDEFQKPSLAHWLDLPGLTELTPEVAGALARMPDGLLAFRGLTELTPAAAAALARFPGRKIFLSGLKTLTPDAARGLEKYQGSLDLDGLTLLTPEAARSLAKRPQKLDLSSLATLTPEVAAALAECRGPLDLLGPETLTTEVATALATYHGSVLYLGGFATLTPEVAAALALCRGRSLVLRRVIALTPEAASALVKYRGELTLPSLRRLTPETAAVLAKCKPWDGWLPAITALDSPDSVAIARALAQRFGALSLPNLRRISPKTLTALVVKVDVEIPMVDTLELIPEPDGSPTEEFVPPKAFARRQERERQEALRLLEAARPKPKRGGNAPGKPGPAHDPTPKPELKPPDEPVLPEDLK